MHPKIGYCLTTTMQNKLVTYRIILLVILLLPFRLQALELKGIVRDTVSGYGVQGAGVYACANETTTDSTGHFSLQISKPGWCRISIWKEGYLTVKLLVYLADKDTAIGITMTRSLYFLKRTIVSAKKEPEDIGRLGLVEGGLIFAGKKNEVINIGALNANLATNNSRQVFAKVPGLNINENDGAGIQLGIGSRGLNPNRVSNFNTRQNGCDMSADALGYPESYYSPPTEAVDRIEIVRGAASLQYGSQFGGLINFKMKEGALDKRLESETRLTMGSFGFMNLFTSAGGTVKKVNYYGFLQYKQGDGWRPNSSFDVYTGMASVSYKITPSLSVKGEFTHMNYLSQQPGGLTDAQFEANPRLSFRNRNWFKVNWNLFAITLDYKHSVLTQYNLRLFGLRAERSALGYLGAIQRSDPGKERDLLSDAYRNMGAEARMLHRYRIAGKNNVLLTGIRVYRGNTHRTQGLANNADGPDFDYLNNDSAVFSDYTFPSLNYAVFAEQIFFVTGKLTVTPGVRAEWIDTRSKGRFVEESRDLAGNLLARTEFNDNLHNKRGFVLGGIGIAYFQKESLEWYANISRNYRAINFNDMRVVNPNLKVDAKLKDEKGFSADFGIRGSKSQRYNFDVSLFYLGYKDRIGTVLLVDSFTYVLYRYRTNVADSRNLGVEIFFETELWRRKSAKNKPYSVKMFVNASYIDARYTRSSLPGIKGNKAELAPPILAKTGLSYTANKFKATFQISHTSSQFTDASNAFISSNAVIGEIPSYTVADLSFRYTLGKRVSLLAGCNNLANNMYFTRRADGYPGPGIIPSDGRSFYFTLAVKI